MRFVEAHKNLQASNDAYEKMAGMLLRLALPRMDLYDHAELLSENISESEWNQEFGEIIDTLKSIRNTTLSGILETITGVKVWDYKFEEEN